MSLQTLEKPLAVRDAEATAALRAGVAKSDITIEDPAILVHDPLYAKALVFDDGSTRLAIIAMDVVAIGLICDVKDDFLPRVRARIEAELAIPARHVLVNASHSHPPGRTLVDPDELVDRVFDAVRRAAADLTPVTVGAGSGYEDRFAINRTLRLKDGRQWTIRHANPCPPDEDVAELGPLDPEVGVLRVDRADGTPLAVVYNYACHPLMGFNNGGVTANYPGFASEAIEETLGNGAMALFLQGAGGDVCDVLYKDQFQPRDMRPFGMMLGLSTLNAWSEIETAEGAIRIITETVELPRRTDIPTRIAELEREQAELLASLRSCSLNFRSFLPLYLKYALNPDFPADYSYRYLHNQSAGSAEVSALDADNRGFLDKYLHNIRAMERLAHIQDDIGTLKGHKAFNDASGEATFTAEVMGVRIGDFVLITCPAEMLTEVGLRVKQASPHPFTFISAFSNGYAHYGPPAADYGLGGYETTECFLAPEWQAIYEEKAQEILRRL